MSARIPLTIEGADLSAYRKVPPAPLETLERGAGGWCFEALLGKAHSMEMI